MKAQLYFEMPKFLSLKKAKYLRNFKIQLVFNDGKKQVVDFGPFLKASRHPSIQEFLNPKKFKSFRLEHGDILWGDYDLCFPIIDLYENKILKS